MQTERAADVLDLTDVKRIAAALESDAFDVNTVDVATLMALRAVLSRCTVAVDGLLIEKKLSSLKIAPERAPLKPVRGDVLQAPAQPQVLDLTGAAPPADKENNISFKLGKQPTRKSVAAAPPPARDQPADQAATRSMAPAVAAPRMPRLLVVIDTNELVEAAALGSNGTISRAYLLQDCAGCVIVLPAQVAKELDGLKRSADAALAARARQANALLSEAARCREPWLLCEPRGAAAAAELLTADECVLRCATDFAASVKGGASDRVVLATSDRNLLLRAAAAHVEAMPLAEARAHGQARLAAWRAAYGMEVCDGATAIARAQWARRASATSQTASVVSLGSPGSVHTC